MKIKFWGVRGSIPCPGPNTVKYGGNTSCLEIWFEEIGRLIIIDAGSGIRELGNDIMKRDIVKKGIKADILLTHTHWDHIMGFPFFTPIYIPGAHLKVYGPVTYEDETLAEAVGGQLTYRYFPVRQAELAAKIEYISLKEEKLDMGDGINLTTKYLNHPVLCLGYRFEYKGKIFCTAYDTEPFQNVFCNDPDDPSYDEGMAKEGEEVAREENQRLENFFSGSDLLIYDAQYKTEEYLSNKRGWGHTSIEDAIDSSERAGVKRLALFHHEPLRTDKEIDELAQKLGTVKKDSGMEVFFAREGEEIVI
ncbi:MAG: MBL fold metallo-hydrolase [Desulfatiglans sp.]|nr:MBL fold metallo-hydrolase [Desulfatiglans sp.]